MAKITSSGPNLIPILKQLVDLTRDIKFQGGTEELNTKLDELIDAVKEITER